MDCVRPSLTSMHRAPARRAEENNRRHVRFAVAVILLCPLALRHSGTRADQPTTRPAAEVVVTTIDGKAVNGVWQRLADGTVHVEVDGQATAFKLDELAAVQFVNHSATRPADNTEPTFYLADGSRFPATLSAADGKQITLVTRPTGEFKLPMTALAGLRYGEPEPAATLAEFEKALADRPATDDTLFVVREGRLTSLQGLLETLTPKGGTFRWRERSVPIKPDNTYGIVFAQGVTRPEPAPATCLLIDGTIHAGQPLRTIPEDGSNLELKAAAGKLALPLDRILELRFRSDRVLRLSTLEPREYHFEPFSGTRWEWRRDRSAANRRLRIGGETYATGIGMHSQSSLTYNLPDTYKLLAADIGIDEAVGPLGNVVFRVLADGREVFNSGPVTGRDAPRPILVDIGVAKELTLAVDFGEGLDIGDQADWGNVRLLK